MAKEIENQTKKEAKKGNGCISFLFFVFACISSIVAGIKSCTNNLLENHGGYITTLQKLNEYSQIESSPMGKETGYIPYDSVLKVLKVTNKGSLTWITVYKLSANSVSKTYVLLPERTNIKNQNNYVLFNENSRTWNEYYAWVDKKNEPLLKRYQKEFIESIKDIEIIHGKGNIERESIKESSWIFDSNGYFGMFTSSSTDFYYIKKDDKSNFLKSYKELLKKYEKEKLKYFPNK